MYLVPKEEESNVSKAIRVPIKPLNLHSKIDRLPENEEDLHMS